MFERKKSLQSLQAYKPSTIKAKIKLDANEANHQLYQDIQPSPFPFNRYPDSNATKLKEAIALDQAVKSDNVMVGNGSSELLELIVKTYLNPSEVVLSIAPSFVMYEKYVLYNNGQFMSINVNEQMTVDIDELIKKANQTKAKIIFLCTPNNPTGQRIPQKEIIKLLSQTTSIVVVDEAYIEFASEDYSVIPYINQYKNLFVTRTFSKAYGLAALRVGYLISSKENIDTLSIVKTPYNISQLSQNIALNSLKQKQTMIDYVSRVNQQKQILREALEAQSIKVFPSEANFLLVETSYPLATKLLEHNILIRSFPNNLYRITIPANEELTNLLNALKEVQL